VDALHKNNVRLKFIGAKEQLSGRLQKRLASSERQTENNTGMSLTLAVAYGGRWDITHAVRAIADKVSRNEINAADITEKDIAANLSLAGMDPPDLLIRTGGERRISNFLLWDMAYSELYFTDTLWPEFGAEDLDLAIDFFSSRERRFGRTGEQLDSKTQSPKSEVGVND
jgi:undecaprenyl diphosphate synthase